MKETIASIQARIEKGLNRKPPAGYPDKSDKEFWRAWRIATFMGVGTIWVAPGTMGSLAGLVFMVVVLSIAQLLFGSFKAGVIIIAVMVWLFFLGIRASNTYMKTLETHDPGEIVIDEVVGMMLTIVLTLGTLWMAEYHFLGDVKAIYAEHVVPVTCMMFFSFRVMDVVKPWPISLADEKVKGGFGVMLDDVLAAIFAAAACLIIYSLLLTTLWKTF